MAPCRKGVGPRILVIGLDLESVAEGENETLKGLLVRILDN